MALGEVKTHVRKQMISGTQDKMPIYFIESQRKTNLCLGKSILVDILEGMKGNPMLEVDSRLIEVLENLNRSKRRPMISPEGQIMSITLDYSKKSYGVELCDIGRYKPKPQDRNPWLTLIQRLYKDGLGGDAWGTSIQADIGLSQVLEKVFAEELKLNSEIELKSGAVDNGNKIVFNYDCEHKMDGSGRIPLPHVGIENKRRDIRRPQTWVGSNILTTVWYGLVLNIDLSKIKSVARYSDGFDLRKIYYRCGLREMFFSVGSDKLGFMIQAKYSNGKKIEIIQAWDDERKCWYSQFSGPEIMLHKLKEYDIFFC